MDDANYEASAPNPVEDAKAAANFAVAIASTEGLPSSQISAASASAIGMYSALRMFFRK